MLMNARETDLLQTFSSRLLAKIQFTYYSIALHRKIINYEFLKWTKINMLILAKPCEMQK